MVDQSRPVKSYFQPGPLPEVPTGATSNTPRAGVELAQTLPSEHIGIGFLLSLHRDIDRLCIEIEETSLYDIFFQHHNDVVAIM